MFSTGAAQPRARSRRAPALKTKRSRRSASSACCAGTRSRTRTSACRSTAGTSTRARIPPATRSASAASATPGLRRHRRGHRGTHLVQRLCLADRNLLALRAPPRLALSSAGRRFSRAHSRPADLGRGVRVDDGPSVRICGGASSISDTRGRHRRRRERARRGALPRSRRLPGARCSQAAPSSWTRRKRGGSRGASSAISDWRSAA